MAGVKTPNAKAQNTTPTRKLSYRKDDRTMSPIYGCMPWKFGAIRMRICDFLL